jgi:hypothetical protein
MPCRFVCCLSVFVQRPKVPEPQGSGGKLCRAKSKFRIVDDRLDRPKCGRYPLVHLRKNGKIAAHRTPTGFPLRRARVCHRRPMVSKLIACTVLAESADNSAVSNFVACREICDRSVRPTSSSREVMARTDAEDPVSPASAATASGSIPASRNPASDKAAQRFERPCPLAAVSRL